MVTVGRPEAVLIIRSSGGKRAVLKRPFQFGKAGLDHVPQLSEALRAVLGRYRILHLGVLVIANRGDDLMARSRRSCLATCSGSGLSPGAGRFQLLAGREFGQRLAGEQIAVRYPEELEMAGGPYQVIDVGHDLIEGGHPLPLVQQVAGADRQVDLAQQPDPAKRVAGQVEQVALSGRVAVDQLAAGHYHPGSPHRGRDVAQGGAGAVGTGRDGSGDRLLVDIALIDQRQPSLIERFAELVDPAAGPHGDHRLGVRLIPGAWAGFMALVRAVVDQTLPSVGFNQQTVGGALPGEWLWEAPTARTVQPLSPASCTADTSSFSELGRRIWDGSAVCRPDQFDHLCIASPLLVHDSRSCLFTIERPLTIMTLTASPHRLEWDTQCWLE